MTTSALRIGIAVGDIGGRCTVDQLVDQVRSAADDGFPTVWCSQVMGLDALTALAVAGREVPAVELGTAVIPVYPHHPAALAAQALTAAQAAGGSRVTLGIGLSHQPVVEGMWGIPFERPAAYMEEYLAVLGPLLRDGEVSYAGERLTGRTQVWLPDRPGVPVLLAALGPRMLRLAGEQADGTITWMTGPATLAGHTVPALRAAAGAAGRPAPRVVAGFPIGVTDDPAALRVQAAKRLSIYGVLPSYRAMLDREGVAGPEDLVIAGDEAAVGATLDRLVDAGVTDLWAVESATSDEDRARTRAFLADRVGGGA